MYRVFLRRRVREVFSDVSAAGVDRHARRFREDAVLELRRGGGTRRIEGRDVIREELRREFPEPGRHALRIEEIWSRASPSGPASQSCGASTRPRRRVRRQG